MNSPLESLVLLCPTVEETDLLRACLWSGTRGREAWERWQHAVGNVELAIKNNRSGIKSLLPLLHHGVRQNGATAPLSVSAVLNSATLAEKRRYDAYSAIAARAFDALAAAGTPFLLLRGAALAVSAYPDSALRHSHDVDLLIHATDRERAIAALRNAGFAEDEPRTVHATVLRDASGMPVALHGRMYRMAYYTPPLAQIWGRARRIDFSGRMLLTPSPADHLVHVCGHASCCASRDALKWVADAWYVITRNDDLDWDVFLATSEATQITLPFFVMLRYLATDLEAPIPTAVLNRLRQAAHGASRAAREVALSGLRAGTRGRFRNLASATTTWSGRLDLLRWMFVPVPSSLRQGEPLQFPHAWPAYYIARPLAYLARRARHWLARP